MQHVCCCSVTLDIYPLTFTPEDAELPVIDHLLMQRNTSFAGHVGREKA